MYYFIYNIPKILQQKEQASRKNYHKFPFVTSLLDLNGYRHGDEKVTRTIYIIYIYICIIYIYIIYFFLYIHICVNTFVDYMWDMRNLDLLYGIELKSFKNWWLAGILNHQHSSDMLSLESAWCTDHDTIRILAFSGAWRCNRLVFSKTCRVFQISSPASKSNGHRRKFQDFEKKHPQLAAEIRQNSNIERILNKMSTLI